MPSTSFIESKLFKIWPLLDRQEHIQLRKWLGGPWGRSPAQLLALYDVLSTYYPDFRADELSREFICKRLFPKQSPDTKWLATHMSLLTRQLEEFLVHQEVRRREELKQQLLIEAFHERGGHEWVGLKISKMVGSMHPKPPMHYQDLLHLSWVLEKRYRFSSSRDKVLPEGAKDLLEAKHSGKLAYKWRMYRFLLELSEREKILGIDYGIEQQISALPATGKEEIPALKMFEAFLTHRHQTGIKSFRELKELWLGQRQHIGQEDKSMLLFYLINIGARIHMQGEDNVLTELLELYKIGVQENLLLEGHYMTTRTFANVVTTANLVRDFDFVRLLIQTYSHKLPPDIQQDAISWAKTHLAFNSKDPDLWESSSKLLQIGSIKNRFTIRTRILLIQMWFEDYFNGKEKDGSFMLYFIDAFNLQLKRSRLYGPERLAAVRAFIKYTRTLIRLRGRKQLSSNKLAELQLAVKATHQMPAKRWLMLQLEKLLEE